MQTYTKVHRVFLFLLLISFSVRLQVANGNEFSVSDDSSTVPSYYGASKSSSSSVSGSPFTDTTSISKSSSVIPWAITQKKEVTVGTSRIQYSTFLRSSVEDARSGSTYRLYFIGPRSIAPYVGVGVTSSLSSMTSPKIVRIASGNHRYITTLPFPITGVWYLGNTKRASIIYSPFHRFISFSNASINTTGNPYNLLRNSPYYNFLQRHGLFMPLKYRRLFSFLQHSSSSGSFSSAFINATGPYVQGTLGFNGPNSRQQTSSERIFETIISASRSFPINPDLADCSSSGCVYAENKYTSSGVSCKVYVVRFSSTNILSTYNNYACLALDASTSSYVIARAKLDGTFDTLRIGQSVNSSPVVKSPGIIGSSVSPTSVLYDIAVSSSGVVAAIATTSSDNQKVFVDNQVSPVTSFKASDICFSGTTLYILDTNSNLYKSNLSSSGLSIPTLLYHDVLDLSCSDTGNAAFLQKVGNSVVARYTNSIIDSALSSSPLSSSFSSSRFSRFRYGGSLYYSFLRNSGIAPWFSFSMYAANNLYRSYAPTSSSKYVGRPYRIFASTGDSIFLETKE